MRVPGQKFFVPANLQLIAGMARSYKFKSKFQSSKFKFHRVGTKPAHPTQPPLHRRLG